MASSLPNSVLGLLAAAASSMLAAQTNDAPREDLLFDSDSLTLDRRTNLIELQGPSITQGDMHIEADRALATGTEFEQSSEWRFIGHVKITVDTVTIEADTAVFTFENEQLARGELEGQPASFRDSDPEREKPVRGGANKLEYDYVARTLRMSEDAWINKDQYEIQGCDIIYDFNDERVTSGSSDCGAFRIRVVQQPDVEGRAAEAPQ
jgi:lipopolysaccharide transport protein LptA